MLFAVVKWYIIGFQSTRRIQLFLLRFSEYFNLFIKFITYIDGIF